MKLPFFYFVDPPQLLSHGNYSMVIIFTGEIVVFIVPPLLFFVVNHYKKNWLLFYCY